MEEITAAKKTSVSNEVKSYVQHSIPSEESCEAVWGFLRDSIELKRYEN